MGTLNYFDCSLLKLVYSPHHPLWLNHILGVFSDYRIWVVTVVLLICMGLKTGDRRYYYVLVWTALCIGLSDLVSAQLLKPYFERIRPCLGDCISTLRWACASNFSFPSNHATNAMAMVTVSIFFSPSLRLKYVQFVIALLIGFSRVYFGVHYPGDVLGGFLIGATVSGIFCLTLKFLLKWRR